MLRKCGELIFRIRNQRMYVESGFDTGHRAGSAIYIQVLVFRGIEVNPHD
jgi:hypothetical protein